MTGRFVWGSPEWIIPVGILLLLALAGLYYSYSRARGGWPVWGIAPFLKVLVLLALGLILLEPLYHGNRPRPGANLFLLVADNSESMTIRDRDRRESRGDQLTAILSPDAGWLTRLGQDFDIRQYAFGHRLHATSELHRLEFEEGASALLSSVASLGERFAERPVAGMLLFTDGNATDDMRQLERVADQLPPIYPVVMGETQPERDLRIERISVTQTNFQAAPVSILATMVAEGFVGESIVVELRNLDGKRLDQHRITSQGNDPVHVRFRDRPESSGISFYEVRAYAQAEPPAEDGTLRSRREATLANNARLVMVDRGQGPYRVLYVSGRPNWEFKFLRRAVEEDPEVRMTALLRIADREPKFEFRGRGNEATNPLFRGFEQQDLEEVERYDQAVLVRMGVENPEELRDGFPQGAEELFRYHALILDNLEAKFFTADQMSLVQRFVSQRGGGLMMLGGMESFSQGAYARTPIGDVLPVYVHSTDDGNFSEIRNEPTQATQRTNRRSNQRSWMDEEDRSGYRLRLTREGWLQPWVRVRGTEEEEQQRLDDMPPLKTLNRVAGLKPGASLLLTAGRTEDEQLPALAVQNFGRGRSGALLVGDLWRWGLRQPYEGERNEFFDAWQQMVRWMVADVPRRVEVDCRRQEAEPGEPVQIRVRVRDEWYEPLDNARVLLRIIPPSGEAMEMTAEPSDQSAGTYTTLFAPRANGAYRVQVRVEGPDGEPIDERETGWVAEPALEEFASLRPNVELLERLAAETGGEVLKANELNSFVSSLPNRKLPVTEPWIFPLWHRWLILIGLLTCLIGEWGIRRWRGLP
jgi:hypothetical protein